MLTKLMGQAGHANLQEIYGTAKAQFEYCCFQHWFRFAGRAGDMLNGGRLWISMMGIWAKKGDIDGI